MLRCRGQSRTGTKDTCVNVRCDGKAAWICVCTDADGAGHAIHGWATRRHDRGGDGQRFTRGAAAHTLHHDAQLHGVAQPARRHARRVLARPAHHGGVRGELVPRPRGQGHGDQRARCYDQQQQQTRRAGRAGAAAEVRRPGETQAPACGVKAASHPSRALSPSTPEPPAHPHPHAPPPRSYVYGRCGASTNHHHEPLRPSASPPPCASLSVRTPVQSAVVSALFVICIHLIHGL